MRKGIQSIAGLYALAGLIHIGLGLAKGLNLDRLWFSSAGLALLQMAALTHLAASQSWTRGSFLLALSSNLLTVLFLCLLLPFFPAPQIMVLIALGLVAIALISWSFRKEVRGV